MYWSFSGLFIYFKTQQILNVGKTSLKYEYEKSFYIIKYSTLLCFTDI